MPVTNVAEPLVEELTSTRAGNPLPLRAYYKQRNRPIPIDVETIKDAQAVDVVVFDVSADILDLPARLRLHRHRSVVTCRGDGDSPTGSQDTGSVPCASTTCLVPA
jgi:hypothetical protein